MNDFAQLRGFEDAWRPAALPRRFSSAGPRAPVNPAATRARLSRIIRGAPEVLVRVTGAPRTGRALKSHLGYMTRDGALDLIMPDGKPLSGREAILEVAEDWAWSAQVDSRARSNTPIARLMVLSMPEGADAPAVLDSALTFTHRVFGERFDHCLTLHQDTPHPHVHLVVRALGRSGERLNPEKYDLYEWRGQFAQALREHGVEAEASPRRVRGRVWASAMQDRQVQDHGWSAVGWPLPLWKQQTSIRIQYLVSAQMLERTGRKEDQEFARRLVAFVAKMPFSQALECGHCRWPSHTAELRALGPTWMAQRGRERERSR